MNRFEFLRSRFGKERMKWEPQFHISSAGALRNTAALPHDDASQIKTTLAKKTSSAFVRQKAKVSNSKSKGLEVRVRRSTSPISNQDNPCASHLLDLQRLDHSHGFLLEQELRRRKNALQKSIQALQTRAWLLFVHGCG